MNQRAYLLPFHNLYHLFISIDQQVNVIRYTSLLMTATHEAAPSIFEGHYFFPMLIKVTESSDLQNKGSYSSVEGDARKYMYK